MTGFGDKGTSHKNPDEAHKRQAHTLQAAVDAYTAGKLKRSKAIVRRLIKENKFNAYAQGLLATIEKRLGNTQAAAELFEQSLAINPNEPDFLHNYAGLLIETDLQKALEHSQKAVSISPQNPQYHERLGYIWWQLGNLIKGLDHSRKALSIESDLIDAQINMSGILKEQGQLDQSLVAIRKAIAMRPDHADAHSNLSIILREQGKLVEALSVARKAIELKPKSALALYALSRIQRVRGETEEAKNSLTLASKLDPQNTSVLFDLSLSLETKEAAENLIKRAELINRASLPAKGLSMLDFTLANCWHKLGEFKRAAHHLTKANASKLLLLPSEAKLYNKKILHYLNISIDLKVNKESDEGIGRIFIVGVPRSGSSLLEIILSMHPEVNDLGESNAMPLAVEELARQQSTSRSKTNLQDLYQKNLPNLSLKYNYTVDKQLYNFIFTGLIASQLPAAKIIHCRRHPMDNILSMLRSNLTAGNNYTSSVEDAATILIAQERVMRDYKKTYPSQIFTFDYDSFVNEPKKTLVPLLDWLNLGWNDRFLHPEDWNSPINTASVLEVRQPISNQSVGGWKNYASMLEPAKKLVLESGLFDAVEHDADAQNMLT